MNARKQKYNVRLLIISSAIHYLNAGSLSAYGPYVREIDVWADLFSEVAIAAPLRHLSPPGDCLAFTRTNVVILPQLEVGGDSLTSKIQLLAHLPQLSWNLARAIRKYDAVHVRCPGNLGFLGVLLAPLLSRCMVAKYAGQWNGFPKEPSSVWLQRRLLGSRYWRGPVTVYGRWPNQLPHVVPFFTSIMTQEQISHANVIARHRGTNGRLNVLFVGRLSAAKNVDTLIEALSLVKAQGHTFSCSIVGEGPHRARLEALSTNRGLSTEVQFTGGLAHEIVLRYMERADVLVLASETEGWPKSIAEAMAFGVICIGSNRGFVPEMLADGRGVVVPARDPGRLAQTICEIATAPQRFEPMRIRASEWARQFSLEKLRDAVRDLLSLHWNVPVATLSPKLQADLHRQLH